MSPRRICSDGDLGGFDKDAAAKLRRHFQREEPETPAIDSPQRAIAQLARL